MSKVQIIEHQGEPAFAVLPIDEYRQLQQDAEMLEDIRAFDSAVSTGVESFPAALADRLIDGVHPVRVFREHRRLTAATLAKRVGVTPAAISQIENRKRGTTLAQVKAIANALAVTVDDLID